MKKLFLFLLSFLVITSCGKGPETVTVNPDNSELFTAPDSATVADSEDNEFIHIKLVNQQRSIPLILFLPNREVNGGPSI